MKEVMVLLAVAGAAGLVAAAVLVGLRGLVREIREHREQAAILSLLRTFAPAAAETARDPKALLQWFPLVSSARVMFPRAFAALDGTLGRPFPFGSTDAQEAHSRWTADWLAWEASHDAEYKLKAATLDEQLQHLSGDRAALVRAELAAVEREQLERYQQRYVEYVRVGKALASLGGQTGPAREGSQGAAHDSRVSR